MPARRACVLLLAIWVAGCTAATPSSAPSSVSPTPTALATATVTPTPTGTGGKQLRPVGDPVANSEVIIDDAWGVLRLDLAPDGYQWSFVSVDGVEADTGSGECG
jgi:hypothetical protein